MNAKKIIFPFLALFCSSIIAQKKQTIKTISPVSIYTLNTKIDNRFNTQNKQFSNDHFVYENQLDINTNTFSFSPNDLNRKPTKLINYDYKRFQDQKLIETFLLKNDPTRWCVDAFRQ